MSHHHSHNHELKGKASPAILFLCIIVNIVFVAAEAMAGVYANSSALLSDAGHNLADVLGLLLSFAAVSLERHRCTKELSNWITLANGFLLLATVLAVVYDSAGALLVPSHVKGDVVILTALAGIVINGFTVIMLVRSCEKGNINIKVAYLHALSDMLVSLGVLLSGAVVGLTGFDLIDPLVSLCVSLSISAAAVKLLVNAIKNIKKS